MSMATIVPIYRRLTSSSFHSSALAHQEVDEAVVAMGRKRNKGKARRAAKAKARQEAEQRGDDYQATTNGRGQSLSTTQMRPRVQGGNNNISSEKPSSLLNTQCLHGIEASRVSVICAQFVDAFKKLFPVFSSGLPLKIVEGLEAAQDATMGEFAEVWHDAAKINQAMSFLLYEGAESVLDGSIDHARGMATLSRYLEEYIAVELKRNQALINWPKINESYKADVHTLATFFKKRIPCSCLDERYQEVKVVTKVSICYNPRCPIPQGEVEHSKTMCCSRCRCAIYCSRECQVADWRVHKPYCDANTAIIAKFEATQQSKHRI